MAVDDMVDSKLGIAAAASAVTASILSPKARDVVRRGAVYGLAGVLTAGDVIAAFARGVGRGANNARSRLTSGETDDGGGAKTSRTRKTSTRKRSRRTRKEASSA
jgi:hypothetical protein